MGHDTGDEADAVRLSAIDHAAGEDHVHGFGLADGLGEADGATHAGRDAELDFRLAELRLVRCDDQVAHHGEFAPTTKGEAVDCRDDGLAGCREAVPASKIIFDIHVGEALRLHLLDVGAGGEGAAFAGKDGDRYFGVAIDLCEQGRDLCHCFGVQSIEAIGPVQRNERDAISMFESDRVVICHVA